MPRSTRTQHESGPGAPSGASDATPGGGLASEHPIEEPGEGWSVLPRPHARTAPPRIQILNPVPMIDCGRFPAKRTVGEWVEVSADVFRDGHEILRAQVRYRGPGDAEWSETPMRWIDREVDGDRWAGAFEVDRVGRWEFTVEAWSDLFATWRDELRRKLESGQHDLRGELSEGAVLLEEALDRMREEAPAGEAASGRATGDGDGEPDPDRRLVEHVLVTLADAIAPEEAKHDAVLGPELLAALERHPDRHDSTCLERGLPLEVERVRARFGAWYELFPRSFGGFEGVRRRLPKLAELGFDVLYLPPIHPIGLTNRKGRNNALEAKPGDPGSPWAIGGDEGGHDAIHPELGTAEEFEKLVAEAREHGLEIALDFAIQCSADHPWLKEHPDWFNRRPDGTLKYAENPPEALPGHLQRELGLGGLARALGRAEGCDDDVGGAGRAGLPRGQPAHQATAVLGVADRRGALRAPRRDLPVGGLHPPREAEGARQGRLQPVLHVLHLEELAPRADRVHARAGLLRHAGVLPPELLRQHAGHPQRVPRARRPARVRDAPRAGGHAVAHLRHLLGLRALRERAA